MKYSKKSGGSYTEQNFSLTIYEKHFLSHKDMTKIARAILIIWHCRHGWMNIWILLCLYLILDIEPFPPKMFKSALIVFSPDSMNIRLKLLHLSYL